MSVSTIILPVENQVRELDAKLLLACAAAERGFPVILGSRAFVHYRVATLPRGVYMAKSMRKLSDRMFTILRRLGHHIVAWDEEGLVRPPTSEYYRRRLSAKALGQTAHLLAWGEDNARCLSEYPGYHGAPIHVTGNPRIDLMRPELRDFYRPGVDAIRARHGDFILINTNFGQINHYFPHLGELKAAVDGRGPDADNAFDVRYGSNKLSIFESFQKMLPRLCEAFPRTRFVLRPHPSENHAPWLTIAAAYPNLQVLNHDSVTPWIMAARGLIANGCTTLLEAGILGLPAINYRPLQDEGYETPLPQHFGRVVNSVDEVIAMVKRIVQGESCLDREADERQQALLRHHIEALSGEFACDRMVSVLQQAHYHERQPEAAKGMDYLWGWCENHLRTLTKQINMRKPGHRNNIKYHLHRFPPIAIEELRARITRISQLLDRFHQVRIEQQAQFIYHIHT